MREDIGETTVNNENVEGIIVSRLLHPAAHFEHPNDVLAASHLSEQEKRAILASWASDKYAVESMPALRHYAGSSTAVKLSDVMAALRSLDTVEVAELQTPLGDRCGRRLELRSLLPMRRRIHSKMARR